MQWYTKIINHSSNIKGITIYFEKLPLHKMINDKTRWPASIMAIVRFITKKATERAIKQQQQQKKKQRDVINIIINRKKIDIPYKEYIMMVDIVG